MRVINRIAICAIFAMRLAAADSSERDRGLADFDEGKYSEALPELRDAARDKSDQTAAAFLALTQAALGDCNAALPGLTAKRADARLTRLSGLAAVKCYEARGGDPKEYALLSELERQFPGDADVWYLAAKAHMKGFTDATFAMFQHTPASYRVHELSGEIFELQNRYSDAIAEYRKAIELNPRAPDLHYRFGRALLLEAHSASAFEDAGTQFEQELKLSPQDAACEFQLGQIAQVQGKAEVAQGHFERALALSPGFVQAMVALGKLYLRQKQYDRAIKTLTKATELQPDNEGAHYSLMAAYRDSGDMRKAGDEKAALDRLQKPPEGEFTDFLKKLGEKPPEQ